MTSRTGQQSHLPPWFMAAAPATHTNLPPLEPLAPNPQLTQPSQPTQRKRQARPGPQARRATKRETHAKLVQAAQEQPRDTIGRFAEKGNPFTRFFDPTPRGPTRLKPLKHRPADQQKRPATTAPRARTSKRKHKKPVPERSFFGKIVAFCNGDYSRWRMRNLREQARLRAQIDGYYVPKKRIRRRKRRATQPTQPTRKRGLVRRILGL